MATLLNGKVALISGGTQGVGAGVVRAAAREGAKVVFTGRRAEASCPPRSTAGLPYLAPYVSAKAGLAGLTRNAAYAHHFDRIRINGLDIGWTDTEGETAIQQRFHGGDDNWAAEAAAKVPMGKLGQVDEIADMVVFLLSDRSGVVTGSVIDWDQTIIGGQD